MRLKVGQEPAVNAKTLVALTSERRPDTHREEGPFSDDGAACCIVSRQQRCLHLNPRHRLVLRQGVLPCIAEAPVVEREGRTPRRIQWDLYTT